MPKNSAREWEINSNAIRKGKFTLQPCTSAMNMVPLLSNGEERSTTTLFLPPCLFDTKKYLRSIRWRHGKVRQAGEQVFFHSEIHFIMKTKPAVWLELTHTTRSPVRTLTFIHTSQVTCFQILNSVSHVNRTFEHSKYHL